MTASVWQRHQEFDNQFINGEFCHLPSLFARYPVAYCFGVEARTCPVLGCINNTPQRICRLG